MSAPGTVNRADSEQAVQEEIRNVVVDLEAIRGRILALKDRCAALPGFEEAEAVNRKSGNTDVMTLALRLYVDLEGIAGTEPFFEEGLAGEIQRLQRAAGER